jgi:transcriptional repressor NrdR
MRCPFCKSPKDKVIDSRSTANGFVIRRRRQCRGCNRRYTTYERVEETPLQVVKKDGRRELYERKKLMSGLLKACHKRPVSVEDLERLVDSIEAKINESSGAETPSSQIGEMVVDALKKIDQVAYVRFASVYRDFEDVSKFVDEIRPMLSPETPG